MKTPQELAQAIAGVDWPGVQADSPDANEQLHFIRSVILKMDKTDAVNMLLEVLEVKCLNSLYPGSIFSEMLRFERMYHSYPSFVPVDSEPLQNEDRNTWFELLVKLNSMAQYKDNRHFGLPMSQAQNIIAVMKQDYELKKVS